MKKTIKKYFSYPMLLLAVVSLFNLGQLISGFISIFRILSVNPVFIINSIRTLFLCTMPLVILIILWLDRFQKIKNARVIIASFFSIYALFTLWSSFSLYRTLSMLEGSDWIGMVPSIITTLSDIVLYAILAALLFSKSERYDAKFRLFSCIFITILLIWGIAAMMTGAMSITGILLQIVKILAIWHIPQVLKDSRAVDLTKKRATTWLYILVVVLVFYVWNLIPGGSRDFNGTCQSCGRSFDPGDSGKNYGNIGKTGFCNNCENNLHSMECVLNHAD